MFPSLSLICVIVLSPHLPVSSSPHTPFSPISSPYPRLLQGVSQEGNSLPDGPVILSPDRLFKSAMREVVQRRPQVFKIAALRDIGNCFKDHTPFYAGFGNRNSDVMAYKVKGVMEWMKVNRSGVVVY